MATGFGDSNPRENWLKIQWFVKTRIQKGRGLFDAVQNG